MEMLGQYCMKDDNLPISMPRSPGGGYTHVGVSSCVMLHTLVQQAASRTSSSKPTSPNLKVCSFFVYTEK